MLTSDQLRVVLGSADHRRSYGLELPDASLNALNDSARFTAFYDRWTAEGQPRYVPPVAAPAAPTAPAAMPMPVPPMPMPVPPAPVMAQFAPPPVPAPPAGPMTSVAVPSAVQTYVQPQPPNPYSAAAPFGSAAPDNSAMPYTPNMHNYVATPTGSRPGLAPMLIGFGIAAAGIIITLVTWEFAAPGGTFVVAWGSILFGSIRGIRGAMQFSRGR